MRERLREERIGIEDQTRHYYRPVGQYLIETFDCHIGLGNGEAKPTGHERTRDDTRHKEAVVRARSLTREHQSVRLTGPLEVYDPPAL